MSKCNTGGCGSFQFNAANPKPFVQGDLQNLGRGESMPYTTGCTVNGTYCNNVDLGYKIYPDNDEYIGNASNVNCQTCNNNMGCDYNGTHDPSVPCDCCCNYGAPRNGTRCAVQRVAYNGQPASCCLLSTTKGLNGGLTGNRGDILYWDRMQSGTYTCDPDTDCSTAAPDIALYCSWFSRQGYNNKQNNGRAWIPGTPTNDNPVGYCTNFVNNYAESQQPIRTVLSSAVDALGKTGDDGSVYSDFGISHPEHAPFISGILDGCNKRGQGACDKGLSAICAKNGWTRDQIFGFYQKYLELSNKPNKTAYENNLQIAYANAYTACGCHLPKADYAEWNKLGVDESNFSCDPLCMLPGAIRQYIGGNPATCDQNLCILDNITIDILNSNVQGGITFTTICGDCGNSPGGCRCIFSDINIFQSGSSVGNINFQQSCGGNCQIPDPNQPGNFIPINCSTGYPISGGGTTGRTTVNAVLQWLSDNAAFVIVSIVVLLILIIVIIWITQKKEHKYKGPGESITLSDMFGDFDSLVSFY